MPQEARTRQRTTSPAATVVVADPCFVLHEPGPAHPESPARYRAVENVLSLPRLAGRLARVAPRQASEDDLHLVHSRAYLATVRHDIARRSAALSTGDTGLGARSMEVAEWAVGAALTAVDEVFAGHARNAFAAVRPPGHHATASRGMGFCIFNNVAVAARYARRQYGVERVLVVDWDVHHGNGTQDIFYQDGAVFYFSTHQSPWYPGTGSADETGAGAGRGTTLNCPLHAGAGHSEVLAAFRKKLLPAMAAYKPDLVLVSAGFDARKGDPLGRLQLHDEDFAELTALVLEIAAESAGGRLVSVLEGGYNLSGLAAGLEAHLAALCGAGAAL